MNITGPGGKIMVITQTIVQEGTMKIVISLDETDDIALIESEVRKICHVQKHRYLDGYPHGRTTRKKLASNGKIFERWDGTPKVPIAYNVVTDNNKIIISAIPSTDKQKTNRERDYFVQLWAQDVTDEILATFY